MLQELMGVPLTPWHQELIGCLIKAHALKGMDTDNISGAAYRNAMLGSDNVPSSIISAIATIGTSHAPITNARKILFHGDQLTIIRSMLRSSMRIPGFGNSFFKDEIDPAFNDVVKLLEGSWSMTRVLGACDIIRIETGKDIPPNAAAITAAVAEECDIPQGMEVWLFLAGRMAGWIKQSN